ncbi:hypothetical protein [Phyllobacterium sp. YR531]|uniref:hypothetical protein n=1 Tax=Phyllobacterium sp. YR531 TaxID=1144343 RepID=UPI00026FA108|nr:hypothetical protein [Phyllobacterium sp. YR531]EJN05963.1 hypothetical protein PMI41_00555 [Phyllobacterium sp. YR531]
MILATSTLVWKLIEPAGLVALITAPMAVSNRGPTLSGIAFNNPEEFERSRCTSEWVIGVFIFYNAVPPGYIQ